MSTLTHVPLSSSTSQLLILLEPPAAVSSSPAALEFALLEAWLASSPALQLPLHQIESQQQTKGREVQRLLLQAHLHQRGPGDVGPALRLSQPSGDLLYTHRRLSTRSLKTIFGTVKIVRMGYSRPGLPSLYPLDQTLALPARSFSYELQRRLGKPARPSPTLRLTKGQKANRKRMATVATVFTRKPWVRTPEQVAESLFRTRSPTSADGSTPPRPENKRVWASLMKGKTAVIQEV